MPIIFFPDSICFFTHAGMSFSASISISIFMTLALAPPCRGPESAPTPAATPAYICAFVETTSRQAKVEALKVWSACSIRHTSSSRTVSGSGFFPVSCQRKFPACDKFSSGWRGARPFLILCQAATMKGMRAISLIAFLTFASLVSSANSVSEAARSGTAA